MNRLVVFHNRVAQQQVTALRRENRRLRTVLDKKETVLTEKDHEIDLLKATIDHQCSQIQALRELVDVVEKD